MPGIMSFDFVFFLVLHQPRLRVLCANYPRQASHNSLSAISQNNLPHAINLPINLEQHCEYLDWAFLKPIIGIAKLATRRFILENQIITLNELPNWSHWRLNLLHLSKYLKKN